MVLGRDMGGIVSIIGYKLHNLDTYFQEGDLTELNIRLKSILQVRVGIVTVSLLI